MMFRFAQKREAGFDTNQKMSFSSDSDEILQTGTNQGTMSKADVLRGFVTDRLSAAAQEILSAVDRIVAGYEEEASGFRLEIEQQRKQLEDLLQGNRINEAGVKCSWSLQPVEEDEGEEKKSAENLALTNQPPSRHFQWNPGRLQISETRTHVDLKIQILEDSRTVRLSNSVLKGCPMLWLKCPRGLQEADFLDLLESAFPQLSRDGTGFDLLTSDDGWRLHPLTVQTLTPEEIHKNVSGTGWGGSTLYIRLKTQKGHMPSKEDQTRDSEDSAPLKNDEAIHQISGSVQEFESGKDGVRFSSSSSLQQVMETNRPPDEDHEIPEASEAYSLGKSNNEVDRKDDWKPEPMVQVLTGSDAEMLNKQEVRHCGVMVPETKTETSDVLSCKVCGAPHVSELVLVKHAWSHVDDMGSVCGVCGELSMEVMKDHLQSHHKMDNCRVCGESFLGEHLAAHSGEKPYECEDCREDFALKESLDDHQKLHKENRPSTQEAHSSTHTNKKEFLCGMCGKSLSDFRSLTRHKMTHSGERPHSCQICGRSFKLPGTLRQHEKIHTDRQRSYLCDVCCKMFLTSKQLQIHMRTHSEEKPYHCGECGKGFTTKGPLTIHMRVHTGEKPYSCPYCGWSFKRKTNLDNHVRVHSGNKPFVCGICGKACARKTYLTVHMRTHNGEKPYKCSLCDKAFTQSHCLKTHMKSHPLTEAAM